MDEKVRQMLGDIADDVRFDEGAEKRTLRRARRRRALNAAIGGGLVVAVALGAFVLGRAALDLEGGTPADPGPDWLSMGGLRDLRAGAADTDGVAYVREQQVFLVFGEGSEVLALSAVSPHQGNGEGERVLYCASSGWFEEQFHGSKFDRLGSYALGPAPRGLDRVPVQVTGGVVEIQPFRVEPGPPRGDPLPLEPPSGSFCSGENGPVEARPGFAAVGLPPITVQTPSRGDRVSSPVTISGTADVFEANVVIEIRDAARNVIAEDFTTASCGTGCRGEYETRVRFDVAEEQPGTIVVYEPNVASEGEGTGDPRLFEVEIPVTLVPPADGAGVDAPAEEKIPYVLERITILESELAAIPATSSDPVDKARRAALENEVAAVRVVLERLCKEVPPGVVVAGC